MNIVVERTNMSTYNPWQDIIMILLWLIGLIITVTVMRRAKSKVPYGIVLQENLTSQEKIIIWITCIVDPILAGAIYYFGWRKVLPLKAKSANLISWLAFVGTSVLYLGLSLMRGTST